MQAARKRTLHARFFDFLLRPPVEIHIWPVCIGVCVRARRPCRLALGSEMLDVFVHGAMACEIRASIEARHRRAARWHQ